MAVQKVVKMGNPVLRLMAENVKPSLIKSPKIKTLIKDLWETMRATEGIGLAAPQIAVSLKVCVLGLEEDDPLNEGREEDENVAPMVLINPEISILGGDMKSGWEACLSVPGLRGVVDRPQRIRVKGFNEKGKQISFVAEGYQAVVIQHETDHLFGKLYVDRITDMSLLGYQDELDHQEDLRQARKAKKAKQSVKSK